MVTKGLKAGTFKEAKLGKTRARREDLARERRIRQTAVSAGRNDLLPELRLCEYRISELAPPRRRTRKDNPAQIERVAASIAEFGFSQPILIRDGIVIDGWIRVLAAQKLGLERVPAIVCDHLDDTQARTLSLAVNRIGELGEWDLDQLKIEFEELIELDVDLDVTGFSAQEQDIILLDPIADGMDEDDACEEPSAKPVSQLDDIWHLGDHRIICGNALEDATYTALLDGEEVHAVLSDFPYNVRIKNNVSGLGKKVHDEFVMASGELSDDEWQAFLDQAMSRLAETILDGSVLFIFMDWRSIHRVYAAADKAGLTLINLAVWYMVDNLVQLIARAFSARDELLVMTEMAISAMPSAQRRHLERTARLSYLAPDIVTAILDGSHPRQVTARKLIRLSSLPLSWAEQRAMLYFPAV